MRARRDGVSHLKHFAGFSSIARTLAVIALALAIPASAAASLKDDRGKTIDLTRPASRIVSLAPFITELVYAAGAGERLVAVTAYSDYPPAARRLPQVGDAVSLDLEHLIALKPDLVIAWKSGNRPSDVTRLERLGIPCLVVEAQQLADIARLLRLIGDATGTAEAGKAASDFERRLDALRARYRNAPPVRVFFEIWHAPLMTVSGRHFASAALAVCGGVNVFGDAPGLTPSVSVESVLAADPQVIFGGASSTQEAELSERWRQFSELSAVRDRHIFYVHPDLIQRQTPRILDGIAQICADLDMVRRSAKP
jgi:iron complex transport system substrate-binding protein